MIPTLNAAYFNEAALYESKWKAEGILDGMPRATRRDRDICYSTSFMLEHQRLANEQAAPATMTGSDDIAVFRRISIPMVRRYFPQLIAHHVVGVQPLTTPSGFVYYMRFRAGITKGDQPGVDNQAGDIKYPTAGYDTTSLQQKTDGTIVAPIWYSHQRVNRETVDNATTADSITFTLALSKIPVLPDTVQVLVADHDDMGLTTGTIYTFIGTINANGTACAHFGVSSTGVTIVQVQGQPVVNNVTIVPSSGIVTVVFDQAQAQTTVTITRCSYEYNLECQANLPRVTLVVESDIVQSKTRKLRADWSIESQQDLKASHNLDVEAEVTTFLAEQVNLEVDREIIEDLRNYAGTVATWDYQTATGDTIKEKFEALYVKLVQVANSVHKKTLRAGANWVIAAPEVCAVFETATAGFAPAPSSGWETTLGIQYVGTVNSKFRCFKDPGSPTDSLVMGYRGDSSMDVGYFYCPYVALMQGPLLYDPETGCPRKGVLTRYGKIMLREGPRYFARVATLHFLTA